jgi:arylsulfatase A-like enzyme
MSPIPSPFLPRSVVVLFALALVLLVPLPAPAAADAVRPNVVVILADDLGYADIGVHGRKDIPTPHIDRLARGGVRFRNGYVSGPYCSPTRAGLLTGRYQTRFGHEFNPGGGKGPKAPGLPLSETTLADRLKATGYRTALVGKWHLGAAPRQHPQKRGFDEFFGFLGGAHPYIPGKGAPIYRGTRAVIEKEYLTDALGREAVGFIERNKEKPFFLYLAFNAVHTPMQATDDRLKKFSEIVDTRRRTYAAMLSAMDDAIGAVLGKLNSAGLDKRTLVWFFNDNGGPTMPTTTINGSRNDPLRGSKRTTLEGGIRVPFVVRWPGKLPAGKVYDHPIIQLDILPTVLAAAGVEVKPEWKIDGVNLLPYLGGEKTGKPHDALFWRMGAQMAVRRGDWKLVRYDRKADGEKTGVTGTKLYNLASDIGEKTDLAEKEPAKVRELQAQWDEWNRDNVRPAWGAGKGK